METRHRAFFFYSDWDLECLLAIFINWYVLREENFKLFLLCGSAQDALSPWKMSSASPNLLLIDGMRKVSKMSVSTCAFNVEEMTTLSPGHLPDINYRSSMTVEICLFSSENHIFMFHWTWTKLKNSASSEWWFITECIWILPGW